MRGRAVPVPAHLRHSLGGGSLTRQLQHAVVLHAVVQRRRRGRSVCCGRRHGGASKAVTGGAARRDSQGAAQQAPVWGNNVLTTRHIAFSSGACRSFFSFAFDRDPRAARNRRNQGCQRCRERSAWRCTVTAGAGRAAEHMRARFRLWSTNDGPTDTPHPRGGAAPRRSGSHDRFVPELQSGGPALLSCPVRSPPIPSRLWLVAWGSRGPPHAATLPWLHRAPRPPPPCPPFRSRPALHHVCHLHMQGNAHASTRHPKTRVLPTQSGHFLVAAVIAAADQLSHSCKRAA